MVDAADQGGISKTDTTSGSALAPTRPTPTQIEEAVILDEQITHAESAKNNAGAAPEPASTVQAILVAPASMRPHVSTPPSTTPPIPTPPVPNDLAPKPKERMPDLPSTSIDIEMTALEDPAHPTSELPPTQAQLVPTQPTQRPPSSVVAEANMPEILKAIKLPERFAQKGSADKKPPTVTESKPEPEKVVSEIITPASAQKRTPSPVTPFHTLKNDLQDISREQKVSLVHAISLEEDRRAHEQKEPETPASQQRSKRTFSILFSVLLLLTIGGGIFMVAFTFMSKQTPVVLPIETPSLLFAEESLSLPLSKHSSIELRQILGSTRIANTKTLGSITRIVPVVTKIAEDGTSQDVPATFSEFMKGIGASPPDDLLRALGDNFFLGLHTIDENAPLIVIPVTSYDRAFAGMLAWEHSLNADLAPLFTEVPSTTNAGGIPETRVYEDLVMRNHDVRALKGDKGEIQLYYSFPNQNFLIIAESPYSFTEILNRLQAGRNL